MKMDQDVRSILLGELIGLTAEVIRSSNKSNIGIKGKITDETKNTITIGGRMILKKNIILKFGKVKVDGIRLVGRPEERIKVNMYG